MPRVHTAAVARGLSYSRPGLQSSKKAIMAPSCGPQEGPVRRGKGKELQPPRRRDAHDRNTAARRRSRASWLAVRACEAHPSLRALRNGDLQALVRGPSAPGRAPPSSPTARSPLWLVGRIRPPHHRVRPPSESLGAGGRRQKAKRHSGFPDGAVKRLSHGQVEPRTIEVGSNVKWVSLNEETIPDVDPRLHRGTDPDGKRHACA